MFFSRSTLPVRPKHRAISQSAHVRNGAVIGTGECLSNLNVAEPGKITLEIVDIIVGRDTPGRGEWSGGGDRFCPAERFNIERA